MAVSYPSPTGVYVPKMPTDPGLVVEFARPAASYSIAFTSCPVCGMRRLRGEDGKATSHDGCGSLEVDDAAQAP